MPIGRNDPCPCGSGKKYERCHGLFERAVPASPEATRAKALKAAQLALNDRLMRFARTRRGPHWLHDLVDEERLLTDSQLSDAEMSIVIPWAWHFMPNTKRGVTLAGEFRRRERQRLSNNGRHVLDAYDAAWMSIWEVTDVQPGVGSRLGDVLTRDERFVHDVSSSATLQRFDTLLAIVLTCDGVSFFGGAHAQPLSPRFATSVTKEARRMCRVRTRAVAPDTLRNPEIGLTLTTLWNLAVDDMIAQPR